MKHRLVSALGIGAVIGLLALTPETAAQTQRFAEGGTIDAVYLERGFIVIDDNPYPITSATRVYHPDGTPARPDQLRKKMPIQFNLGRRAGAGRPPITEIWITP